jgi:hypothetical protein
MLMDELKDRDYYLSRKSEILALFETHVQACKPFLVGFHGDAFTNMILKEAREQFKALIPDIPYIGGDENPMTRHLIRSTTSLALYKVMKARDKTAGEIGKVIYEAVVTSVNLLPPRPSTILSTAYITAEKEQARKSQERCYSKDWVWEFVEGEDEEFDYGYDIWECGAQKWYHVHDADEFLPFYCYLDFVTHRTVGWGFARTMTLAEGYKKCDFRWKKGGETKRGWPPPFLKGI